MQYLLIWVLSGLPVDGVSYEGLDACTEAMVENSICLTQQQVQILYDRHDWNEYIKSVGIE